MLIHFHSSPFLNSGEIRRIRNVDVFIASLISDKIIEVEFYPIKKSAYVYSKGKFVLSDKVIKKYYVPMFPFLSRCKVAEVLNNHWMSIALFVLCCIHKPTYLLGEYSVSFKSMGIARKFCRKLKCIVDMHGARPEEYLYSLKSTSKNWYWGLLENYERDSSTLADIIICQSFAMKRHIMDKYKADENKILVYQCGVDTSSFYKNDEIRRKIRNDLRIAEDNIVFVYSGGLHAWQKVDKAIAFFAAYYSFDSHSKFLVLTHDVGLLEQVMDRQQVSKEIRENVICKSLGFAEVPHYLNAADVAFLFRDNVVMNAVASPTKLAEYMACGLPIISSEVAKHWISDAALSYFLILEEEKWPNFSSVREWISLCDRRGVQMYANSYLSLDKDNRVAYNFFKNESVNHVINI